MIVVFTSNIPLAIEQSFTDDSANLNAPFLRNTLIQQLHSIVEYHVMNLLSQLLRYQKTVYFQKLNEHAAKSGVLGEKLRMRCSIKHSSSS